MARDTKMGRNRTGMDMSPLDGKETLQGSERSVPTSSAGEYSLEDIRAEYTMAADPIGSVPPPGTAKGLVKSGVQMITGNRPEVLLDKLGERLAFERGGTRLYDALITKCEALGDQQDVVDLETVRHIRNEEAAHAELVRQAIESMGGDPTAMTPCANLVGVESMGLTQVLNEPRTSIAQSLHSILTAELVDNAGWELLIDLVREAGNKDMAARFERALAEERQHLQQVTLWIKQLTRSEAKVAA